LVLGLGIDDDPGEVLARIHIDAPRAAELLRALEEAACRVIRRQHDIVDVWVPSTTDDEQARVELIFFLRAWVLDHPGPNLRVSRYG
jgi:hypothetical protein